MLYFFEAELYTILVFGDGFFNDGLKPHGIAGC